MMTGQDFYVLFTMDIFISRWSVAGRTVATAARAGNVSSVKIQVANSGPVSRAPGSTNPATANRILQHSIKQTLRDRPAASQRRQQGSVRRNARANVRRRIGVNYGTVRMLSNTITDLKQQVADLQRSQGLQNRQNRAFSNQSNVSYSLCFVVCFSVQILFIYIQCGSELCT